LTARRIRGFDDSLTVLARAAESGATPQALRDSVAQTQAELLRVRRSVNAPPAVTLAAVARVVDAAGESYGAGVRGGQVVNAKAYQDAFGSLRAAKALATSAGTGLGGRSAGPMGRIRVALDGLDPALPSLAPAQLPAGFDKGRFSAAASNIALEAQDLH
jgi:hypothetical protein